MNKKNFLKDIAGYVLFAVSIFFFVFIWNPFHLVVYSFLIGIIIYITLNIRKAEKFKLNSANLKTGVPYIISTYLFIIIIFSLSPYLRVREFQLTHPNYQILQGEVVFSDDGVYKQKGNLYSFVNVDYSYSANGKRYTQQQKEALKFYSFPIFSNTKTEYLKNRVNYKFNQLRLQRNYVIMVRKDNPEESQFFSSREVFYWSGSILKNFLSGILFMVTIFASIGLLAFLFRNNKVPSPEDKKLFAKKLLKILFIVLGIFFGLLFIIYLVLLFYFKSTGKL
jgi:hypothetical protein